MRKRRPWPIHVASVIALAIIYVVVGRLGVSLHAVMDGDHLLVWVPSGIGLAAVILYGPMIAPGVALGACASALLHGLPVTAALVIGLVDLGEAAAGGYILCKVVDFHPELDRVRDVVALVCTAVAITFFDGALISAALVGLGTLPGALLRSNAEMWWWSHLGGDLLVTPLVITFLSRGQLPRTREPARPIERAALAIAVVLCSAIVFYPGFPNPLPGDPRAYQVFPLLLWAGVRFGPRGAAATSFGVGGMAILGTALGKSELGSLVDLHSFVSILSVTTLLLAALHAERVSASRRKAAIQDGALDGILTLDANGRILEANPAAERMFAASAAVLVGRDVARLIVPRQRTTPVTSSAAGQRLRLRALRSDGTEFPIELALTRVALGDRDIFSAFVRDCTAEDAAEDALRESRDKLEEKVRERTAELTRSEEMLQTSQRLAHIGSFEVVDDGVLACSAETLRIFGVPPTFKATIDYFYSAVAEVDRERVRKAIAHAKDEQGCFELEHGIVRPDGSTRILHSTGTVGDRQRIQGCCQDITERRLAEEAKQRLIGIVESTDDAVIGLSLDSRILSWNAAAERMLGYTADQVIGQPVSMLVANERVTGLQERLSALRAGQHLSHYDLDHRRADGTTFAASVTMSVIRDSDGHPIGYSKLLRDISHEKAIEAAQLAALREKEVLLREIHHRVKNNLQVITSLLNLQLANLPNDDTRRALVDSQNRIHSMALVHQQLYQSKNLSRIDLLDYLQNLVSRVFTTIAPARGEVSIDVHGVRIFVDIDRAIPTGLIVNELVTNAITHAFTDGRVGHVDIEVISTDSGARIVVSDNGTGMPEHLCIDDLKTFGLKIADILSRQLGGTLTFERAGGTRVSLEFPIAQASEVKAA